MELNSDYDKFTKEELIRRIQSLEKMLRDAQKPTHVQKPAQKPSRKFNWESVSKRHIFLKFAYFGWDRHGYVSQPHTSDTVEELVLNALMKCCLIESREKSQYHRCGRTDVGVSAFSQVISIGVRSKFKEPNATNIQDELPYCTMLNRILPTDIRFYAWCPVEQTTSARFDCTSRTYTYFFPEGNLNIAAMRRAANYLMGKHDFRNLCKMDVKNGVIEFIRQIDSVDITPVDLNYTESYRMMKFTITSGGFLWHQIRCIMGILLLVGEEKEEPEIIQELLDVERNPCKPQYCLAEPFALVLSDVHYGNTVANWVHPLDEIADVVKKVQTEWTNFTIKSTIIKELLNNFAKIAPDSLKINVQPQCLNGGKISKIHKPLLSRDKCLSLENRVAHYSKAKRRKIEKEEPVLII